jgi:hypothetical protein
MIRGIQLYPDAEARRDSLADLLDDFNDNEGSPFGAATIFVLAVIALENSIFILVK